MHDGVTDGNAHLLSVFLLSYFFADFRRCRRHGLLRVSSDIADSRRAVPITPRFHDISQSDATLFRTDSRRHFISPLFI